MDAGEKFPSAELSLPSIDEGEEPPEDRLVLQTDLKNCEPASDHHQPQADDLVVPSIGAMVKPSASGTDSEASGWMPWIKRMAEYVVSWWTATPTESPDPQMVRLPSSSSR
jgi:hypothetical protein